MEVDLEKFDMTGLTDEQIKAIEALKEKLSKAVYFASIGDYPPNRIKAFLEANKMKASANPAERKRGEIYELRLMAACGYAPHPKANTD